MPLKDLNSEVAALNFSTLLKMDFTKLDSCPDIPEEFSLNSRNTPHFSKHLCMAASMWNMEYICQKCFKRV